MKNIVFGFCFFLYGSGLSSLYGQISGYVRDTSGQVLPHANVLIKGTTIGTTCNTEGKYNLNYTGKFPVEVVYSFVGFKQKTVIVNFPKSVQDVGLEEDFTNLEDMVIVADREDPAYAVIRKAIQQRRFHRDQVNAFQAKVYIKGIIKMDNAPKKFMGVEVGDLNGNLDSTRKGILYLSESESIYKRQGREDIKEIMVSSKVSGRDNGFSFNQASTLDYNIYDNTLEFRRQMLSPIASDALLFYRYKMLGTYVDEDQKIINKIKVIPIRNADPVFAGIINIEEDTWAVRNFDLYMTEDASKISSFDTLRLIQQYTHLKKENVWRLFSTAVTFSANLFGFKANGKFTGIFSDYQINPIFPKGTFNNELMKVEEEANKKDSTYWAQARPIDLTSEEQVDYIRKDSIQVIRESKVYLDSMDRKSNKFGVGELFLGYTLKRSYTGYTYKFRLNPVQFNPVQGLHLGLKTDISYGKRENPLRWNVNAGLSYGFADKAIRYIAGGNLRLNRKDRSRFLVEFGDQVLNQNERSPDGELLNSYWSLKFKNNFIKLYQKKYAFVEYRTELKNGLFTNTKLEYVNRNGVSNHTEFSFAKDKPNYKTNTVGSDDVELPNSVKAEFIKARIGFSYTPAAKYLSYPDVKVNLGSKYPTLSASYTHAFDMDLGRRYSKIAAQIHDEEIKLGLFGTLEYLVQAGYFFKNSTLQFPDYQHVQGHYFWLISKPQTIAHFKILPYYEIFAKDKYYEAYLEYNDNGYILDKIPLLRKLGFFTIGSLKHTQMDDLNPYTEWSIGFDRLGWGKYRMFRLDIVHGYRDFKFWKSGLVLSASPTFGN